MPTRRSPEANKRRYTIGKGRKILLNFSFNDHVRAETVHTLPTDLIVRDQLQKTFPDIPEETFQTEVLNHIFGEILFSPHPIDISCHGDLSNLTPLTQDP